MEHINSFSAKGIQQLNVTKYATNIITESKYLLLLSADEKLSPLC